MVDAAARAGVEVVKHQTHIVEDEMSGAAKRSCPAMRPCRSTRSCSAARFRKPTSRQLQEYVESKGMIFISTPFSRAAADRLHGMNVPAYKIGSGECNNYPLLKHIASFGKPIILSTGMNTIDSVRKAVDDLRERRRALRAAAHDQSLSHAAAPGAAGRDGGARQGVSERGDRPFRSHDRQHRVPRRRRARRVDPRASLHRSHVSARVPTSSARWTRRRAAS